MAEAQESSSPRCLLLLAGGLPSSVSGTILLAGACKLLAYGTRLRLNRPIQRQLREHDIHSRQQICLGYMTYKTNPQSVQSSILWASPKPG